MTRHLVTSALPYANGPIHLGHLVEYLQTDIRVRFLRAIGEDVVYVCADDTHGTPIELNARKQGLTPEALIARVWEEHTRDFAGFGLSFDTYYTTNSPENRELAEMVYSALRDGGHIVRRTVRQMYSEGLGRFLSDRMVRGTCPHCGSKDQYGDVCESCKRTYEPTDLLDPVDAIEGKPPVIRETEQLFVRVSDFDGFLREWLPIGVPQDSVRAYIESWMAGGLRDWAISRDAPYFGFEIPGEPGKYFYVWLDAPIGYIAACRHWCEKRGLDWRRYWAADADATITHVIGKDIVYFHTLFWPAMLRACGLKTPAEVRVHGMLTVNGEKMSKSRGTFIRAETYLRHLDPDYLRFYYAAKLSEGVEDIDLNFEDFVARVNADLVNNVVNLCSRVTKFIGQKFGGALGEAAIDPPIREAVAIAMDETRAAFLRWDFRGAVRRITELADRVNVYFQEAEPWKVMKSDEARARAICASGLFAARALITMLAPVTPSVAGRFGLSVGDPGLTWDVERLARTPERIDVPDRLLDRVDPERVAAIVSDSVEDLAPAGSGAPESQAWVEVESFKAPISIDDFSRVDLRVGVVESAEAVEGAEKLIRVIVQCGRRVQVFAGVRKAYPDPSVLVGRRVIIVANLQPRKMKFGVSEGMLLATSSEDDTGLQLVHPDESTLGGWTVR